MHSHPERSEEPPPPSNRRSVLIGVGIATILAVIVVLHLTGVVGPGAP